MQSTSPQIAFNFSRVEMIEVGGLHVACHRHGSGPKIICLHATGHGARDFVKLAHKLADDFEFIALDWPGQGDSPPDNVSVSAAHYASLLDNVINVLDLQDYVLLGNSIGGAAAIIHASNNPENVRALVLCNPGGLQRVNLIAKLYCQHIVRMFAKGERGDPRFDKIFHRYYEKTVLPNASAAWRRNEIISTGYAVAPILKTAWMGFAKPGADIRALVSKLTMPVFYAWARNDQAVAWSRSKKAALTAPDCTIELFDGGHCAFLESPDEFALSFQKFLNEPDKKKVQSNEI